MLLDVHAHEPNGGTSFDEYLAALERFDSRVVLAHLGARGSGWGYAPTAAQCRESNDLAADLVRRRPDRIVGYCYVNPEHGRETLDEMERCLAKQPDLFAALKLWVAVRCSDPRLDPLMEFCAAYEVPVLQHTYVKVGNGRSGGGNLPGESMPEDLLALARRHPKVKFFGGHTGADWEWGVAAYKQVDNIWMDIGGGEALSQYMEVALRGVGAGRIVFSTDMRGRSIPSQLAKVLCVPLPDADLERILWRNSAEVLGTRLPDAWKDVFTSPPSPLPGGEGRVETPPTRASREQGQGATAATASKSESLKVRRGESAQHSPLPAGEGKGVRSSWSASRLPVVPAPGDGGLFDVNSYLGEWPGRRVNGDRTVNPREQVSQRLEEMDRRGIRTAAVSRLEAVFLKDVSSANAELHELVKGMDRLLPVYTLNPVFPGWREQLTRCIEEYGLVAGRGGIRVHPGHHGYALDAPALDECLSALAPLNVPVVLPVQIEDARLHPPAMAVPDLAPDAVAALLNRWPDINWIVTTAIFAQVTAIARQLREETRAWFDVSRVQGPVDDVRLLAQSPGVRRLVFGTNQPLHVAECAIMELADAHLSPEDDAAIRYGNACRAFGVPSPDPRDWR